MWEMSKKLVRRENFNWQRHWSERKENWISLDSNQLDFDWKIKFCSQKSRYKLKVFEKLQEILEKCYSISVRVFVFFVGFFVFCSAFTNYQSSGVSPLRTRVSDTVPEWNSRRTLIFGHKLITKFHVFFFEYASLLHPVTRFLSFPPFTRASRWFFLDFVDSWYDLFFTTNVFTTILNQPN